MVLFSYAARDRDQVLKHGLLEAESAGAATAALQAMDLSPESIETAKPVSHIAELQEKAIPWNIAGHEETAPLTEKPSESAPVHREYFPLTDTLRLYAGWLLAWYFVIYALGYYQATKPLPLRIGLIDELYLSPMILSFAVASFLFLLLSTIHRFLGRGIVLGILLSLVGIGLFAVYQSNV